MSLTWVDGVAAETVPADDRGLHYADGAFETLSCHEGRIQHEDLHRSRLTRALAALRVKDANHPHDSQNPKLLDFKSMNRKNEVNV